MRSFTWLSILLVLASGCATHGVWDAPGIKDTGSDNPEVTVLSDIDVIKLTPIAMQPPIDIEPDPGLALSFERALERYVESGSFRIIQAEMTVSTVLTKQHVIFMMLVEADGQTHQIRHDWETSSAGWGNKPVGMIPEYLDACAEILATRLRSAN